MYGHHITPRPKTPIAARLRGFIKHFNLVIGRREPDWCECRYAEAWPFRARRVGGEL